MTNDEDVSQPPDGRPPCPQCGLPMPEPNKRGRRRKYCSDSCRQRAYDERTGRPNFMEQKAILEADRAFEKKARRNDRDRARRIEALEELWEHERHRERLECAETVLRSELAICQVLEFVRYLVLIDDVSDWAEGVNMARTLHQLVLEVQCAGFRPEPKLVDWVERMHEASPDGRIDKRSQTIQTLRTQWREDDPLPANLQPPEPAVHRPSLSTIRPEPAPWERPFRPSSEGGDQ